MNGPTEYALFQYSFSIWWPSKSRYTTLVELGSECSANTSIGVEPSASTSGASTGVSADASVGTSSGTGSM